MIPGSLVGTPPRSSSFLPVDWRVPLAAATLGIAALVVVSPIIGLAVGGGLIYLWVCWRDLAVGLALFTITTFFDQVPGLSGSVTLSKGAGGVLVLFWILSMRRSRDPMVAPILLRSPKFAALLCLFVAWLLASCFWAGDSGLALSTAFRLIQDIVLMLVAWSVVRTRQQLWWVVYAFVAGAMLTAVLNIGSSSATVDGRLTGDFGDPNELASVLVPALILVVVIILCRRGLARWAAVACVPLLLYSINQTGSRGGLVALGVAAAGFVVFSGGSFRRVVGILLVLGATVGIFLAIAGPPAAFGVDSGPEGSGRLSLWSVALQVTADHPVFGVGMGNFLVESRPYALSDISLGRVDKVVQPDVAHNSYLQLLAEIGVVGFALFLGVVISVIVIAARACRDFGRRRERELGILGRGLILAVIAMMASQLFLTFYHAKQLWILAGLALAIGWVRDPRGPRDQRRSAGSARETATAAV